ncbi:MAG: hypothetical protein ACLQME_02710 [Alphaproteobacteria bacterium]
MKSRIPGSAVRDRILARMATESREPSEELRIEALAPQGNRELLTIIATKGPKSISELATLAERWQPNVSRSLTALAHAGLVQIVHGGRVSIPTLTEQGRRKAQELGLSTLAPSAEVQSVARVPEIEVVSVHMPEADGSALDADDIDGDVIVRFSNGTGGEPVVATTHVDLNENSVWLLTNWWRLLCRRDDPFKNFPVDTTTRVNDWKAILLARSTGARMEILARPISEADDGPRIPENKLSIFMEAQVFAETVLDRLVRPVVRRLHMGRRFDRPADWMLRRIEESLRHPNELAFCRTAGALGKSPYSMSDADADQIWNLEQFIPDEDARLDFASAIDFSDLEMTLRNVAEEVEAKVATNSLPRLPELRQQRPVRTSHSIKPYRIGTDWARSLRTAFGLGGDRNMGGVGGIVMLCGGDARFATSDFDGEQLRGFLARGDGTPVVVLQDEGQKSTAFVLARAIGDYLEFGSRNAPVADIYTDRQAVGRAFAAELLAPAQGVIHMIEDDNLPMVAVAKHYGVRIEVAQWQYNNNALRHAMA